MIHSKNSPVSTYQLFILTFSLVAMSALAAPSPEVQGLASGVWNTISDGDLNPNQTVTDFGSVSLGNTQTRRYRLRNVGTDTLWWNGASSSNTQFTILNASGGAQGFPVPITSGDLYEFLIRYTPTFSGQVTPTISLATNASGLSANYTFAITGTGLVPDARISGRSITSASYDNILDGETMPKISEGTDFNFIPVGSSVIRYFKLTNDGNTALDRNSVSFNGGSASEFQVNGLALGNLAPGASDEFTITWTPTSPGIKTTTFWLVSDDPDENPYDFRLTGEAVVYPNIRVRGLQGTVATTIEDADHTPDQEVTQYGDVRLGTTTSRTFRILNDGNGTLNISSITSNNAQFTIPGPPSVIAPNDHRDFTITFAPTSAGTTTTIITVNNDTPGDEAQYTFALTGTGIVPDARLSGRSSTSQGYDNILDGETTPKISEGTDFNFIPVGSSVVRYFKITNDGNAPLKIVSTSFNGGSGSEFSVSGLNTGNLAPGGFSEFTIKWSPTTPGIKTTTFWLVSDDPDENPYDVVITGEALAFPDIRVRGLTKSGLPFDIDDGDHLPDQDVTQYGNINPGTTTFRTFRILNEGNGTLNISSITSNNAQFTIPGPPTSILPNNDSDFVINFSPNSIGTKTAIITITSDDPDAEGNYTFALTGTGDGPEIVVEAFAIGFPELTDGQTTLSPADHTEFGEWNIGSGETERFYRIRNTGTTSLRIQGSSFSGSGASHFSVSGLLAGNPFVIISPGEERVFSIAFDPSSVGSKLATFSMDTTDGDESPFSFRVRGTGVSAPQMDLVGRAGGIFTPWVPIPNESTIPRVDNGTQFAAAPLSGDLIVKDLRIVNTGDAVLTITSMTSSLPDFTIIGAPSVLSPGQSENFSIAFDPVNSGQLTATIAIISDDWRFPEWTFDVTGYSWDNVSPNIRVGGSFNDEFRGETFLGFAYPLGPDSSIGPHNFYPFWYPIEHDDPVTGAFNGTDFGTYNLDPGIVSTYVTGNSPEVSYFRIWNEGQDILRITDIRVTSSEYVIEPEGSYGTLPGEFIFSQDRDWVVALESGEHYTFKATFSPSAYGRRAAEIHIDTNDPTRNTFIMHITGFADSNDGPELSRGEVSDARALHGETATVAVRLSNIGNEILTLGSPSSSNPTRFEIISFPTTIAPGQTDQMLINYHAPATGNDKDESTIQFVTNDPDGDEDSVSFIIEGRPGVPDLKVYNEDCGFQISNGSEDAWNFLTFDDTSPGGAMATKRFCLWNRDSAATLTIDRVETSTASFQVMGASNTLGPNQATSLVLGFLPIGGGEQSAWIRIYSDDPDDSVYEFKVYGTSTGVSPPPDIIEFWRAGNDNYLVFQSYPDKTYQIKSSIDHDEWNLSSGTNSGIQGTGGPITLRQPSFYLLDPRAFLRVEEEP